ncbi:MAG: class I SAM-dependent methyltransferase [Spirochaetes bacterium]|nr:class I SAM-dependent methyltransferase [Spirochaetota bacterium]
MDTKSKMKVIHDHFDDEAKQFDANIVKFIPCYDEMLDTAVAAVPFARGRTMRVADLGTGTGELALKFMNAYPKAVMTCVDMSENMLTMASRKLGKYRKTTYVCSDFYHFSFTGKYDAVISSFALHHLVTDADKQSFCRKIYAALKPGGVFVNADVVLGATKHLQAYAMGQWVSFLKKTLPPKGVAQLLRNFKREDSPAPVAEHFTFLKAAGFSKADILWRKYMGAVIVAVK